MAPSIAARRVDGVQGARCPKEQRQEMAALSVPKSPSSRRHFCRPTRRKDGTGGIAATIRPS